MPGVTLPPVPRRLMAPPLACWFSPLLDVPVCFFWGYNTGNYVHDGERPFLCCHAPSLDRSFYNPRHVLMIDYLERAGTRREPRTSWEGWMKRSGAA